MRVFVDDLDRARSFYTGTLGLEVAWDLPAMGAFGVTSGGPELIVEATDPAGEDGALVGRFVGVSLRVEDVVATHRNLTARGVVFTSPPERQPWGGSLAHFLDPAGNTLTLLG